MDLIAEKISKKLRKNDVHMYVLNFHYFTSGVTYYIMARDKEDIINVLYKTKQYRILQQILRKLLDLLDRSSFSSDSDSWEEDSEEKERNIQKRKEIEEKEKQYRGEIKNILYPYSHNDKLSDRAKSMKIVTKMVKNREKVEEIFRYRMSFFKIQKKELVGLYL